MERGLYFSPFLSFSFLSFFFTCISILKKEEKRNKNLICDICGNWPNQSSDYVSQYKKTTTFIFHHHNILVPFHDAFIGVLPTCTLLSPLFHIN